MLDVIMWIYFCVGLLFFSSLYVALAILIWRLFLKDLVDYIREME